jgi:hypothetical protein
LTSALLDEKGELTERSQRVFDQLLVELYDFDDPAVAASKAWQMIESGEADDVEAEDPVAPEIPDVPVDFRPMPPPTPEEIERVENDEWLDLLDAYEEATTPVGSLAAVRALTRRVFERQCGRDVRRFTRARLVALRAHRVRGRGDGRPRRYSCQRVRARSPGRPGRPGRPPDHEIAARRRG